MAIRKLSEEQAQDRTNWLMNHATREFWHLVQMEGDRLVLDEAALDKLDEIARVAKQVANHNRNSSS